MKDDMRSTARDSSIELFRIIAMLCIVAHHYVVNSGITEEITVSNALDRNTLFCLIFGGGGKTCINCFVLITGYFMCKSNISLKKFLKLLIEIEFYNVCFFIFFPVGVYRFFRKGIGKSNFSILWLGNSIYQLLFGVFLFIPYLNLLLKGMDEKSIYY